MFFFVKIFKLVICEVKGIYDGSSNMRGTWNGLQALFLRDCPYAYYVHCFAHHLQLALVTIAKDATSIWQFFSYLTYLVNLVGSSPKCLNELQSAQRDNIARMLASGERESGRGLIKLVPYIVQELLVGALIMTLLGT